jgi:hypothetical protein
MNHSLKESGQCWSFHASQIKEQYASEKLQKEACNTSAEVLLHVSIMTFKEAKRTFLTPWRRILNF